jgi:hypothetical protein
MILYKDIPVRISKNLLRIGKQLVTVGADKMGFKRIITPNGFRTVLIKDSKEWNGEKV